MLKLVVPLMALCLAAPVFNSGPAYAGLEECGDFNVTLPDGWEYQFRRGVHIIHDGEDHTIDIVIEQDRNESLMTIAKEHGLPVKDLGEAAGGNGEDSRFLAAKGDSGSYLEVSVDNALLKKAPAIIRSLKSTGEIPGLQKAFDRVSSQKALDFLK